MADVLINSVDKKRRRKPPGFFAGFLICLALIFGPEIGPLHFFAFIWTPPDFISNLISSRQIDVSRVLLFLTALLYSFVFFLIWSWVDARYVNDKVNTGRNNIIMRSAWRYGVGVAAGFVVYLILTYLLLHTKTWS